MGKYEGKCLHFNNDDKTENVLYKNYSNKKFNVIWKFENFSTNKKNIFHFSFHAYFTHFYCTKIYFLSPSWNEFLIPLNSSPPALICTFSFRNMTFFFTNLQMFSLCVFVCTLEIKSNNFFLHWASPDVCERLCRSLCLHGNDLVNRAWSIYARIKTLAWRELLEVYQTMMIMTRMLWGD